MKSLTGEIERLRSIVAENPQSIYFARLAEYLLQMNNISEALELCNSGLRHHPDYANGHFVLGLCYFWTDDYELAESEFNKALLYDPDHLQAHHYLARIMQSRGWHNTYLVWLKRALAIDPLDRVAKSLLEEAEEAAEETPVIVSEEAEQEAEMLSEEPEEEAPAHFSEIETEQTDVAEEPTATEEVGGEVPEEEISEKDYEYILDDIFKDEVTSAETVEEAESGPESLDEVEQYLEEELPSEEEEMVSSETEEEVVSQIRQKMDEMTAESAEPETEKEDMFSTELEAETEELAAQLTEQLEEESVPKEEPVEEPAAEDLEQAAQAVFDDLEEEWSEEESATELTVSKEEPEEGLEEGTAPEIEEEEFQGIEEEIPETEERPSEPEKPKEPFVTSTLGEIYAAQGHYAKAIGVYEILLKKNPDNELYKQKIEELKRKLEETLSDDSEE